MGSILYKWTKWCNIDTIYRLYIDYISSKSMLYKVDAIYIDYTSSKFLYIIGSILYRDTITNIIILYSWSKIIYIYSWQ